MINNEATIKIRPRMYFISFALGDLGCIILWNCKEFIVTGLWIMSSGGFYIPLYSPGMCKLVVGLFHLFAILAIYSIIAMNCDLVMALYWPLKHKIFMTPQRSSYLLLCFVALTWAIQIPLTLLTTTSIQIPNFPFPICGGDTRNPLYPFYIILTLFLLQGFHPAFLGFLSVLIISKLNSVSDQRREMGPEVQQQKGNEFRTIMTFTLITITTVIMFSPSFIIFSLTILFRLFQPVSPMRDILESLAQFASNAMVVTHSINIIIYIAVLPKFRYSFLNCLRLNNRCVRQSN